MLIQFLEKEHIEFEKNVSLKRKTWIKTGGTVSFWIEPTSAYKLEKLLSFLHTNKIKFEVVGHTSNIYYTNSYNPYIIISTSKLNSFEEKDGFIECSCGAAISKISRYAVSKGYEGFSGLVNLPGTVAAAVCNNSSCFSCDIASLLHTFSFFDLSSGKIVELSAKEMSYSFRSSALKRKEINGIILSVKLLIKEGNAKKEKEKADNATRIRKTTQEPPAYTLGSVYAGLKFKNRIIYKIANWGGQLLDKQHINGTRNRILLFIYGYIDLSKYISNRNINTFKWLPSDTEHIEKFNRYQKFIKKACINPKLEIEIRYPDDN